MIYDFPLNERSRTYLRLENLFIQLDENRASSDVWAHIPYLKAIFDLQSLFEQGDLRADLIKDLERMSNRLKQWAEFPQVDVERIQATQQEVAQLARQLLNAPRPGAALKEDKLLGSVRQRFAIPGGLCAFDVPQLQQWLSQPLEQRQQQMFGWQSDLQILHHAVALLLRLWRESAQFTPRTALNGFFQEAVTGESCELVRIELSAELLCYPTLSGHRNRFALRFLPTTDTPIGDVSFSLAVC